MAILTLLSSIGTIFWSFLSPIKTYLLTAILAIVLWHFLVVKQGWFVEKTWDVGATIESVESPTEITVSHTNLLGWKRTYFLTGTIVDADTLRSILPKGKRVTCHVVSGTKIGKGALTGVIDTSVAALPEEVEEK